MRNRKPRNGRVARCSARATATALVLVVALAACGSGHKKTDATTTTKPVGFQNPGAVSPANCPGSPTTGIVGNTIKIGTSLPQSGKDAAAGAILAGERAFFDYVNTDLGGVTVAGKPYQIQLVAKDDQGDPATTAANATALVKKDRVFALFNVVGTANNIAIRKQLATACVPDLFADSDAPAMANPKYPWLIAGPVVPFTLETQAFVDYLNRTRTHSTVAVLHPPADGEHEYSDSFKAQIAQTTITLAKDAPYDPTNATDLNAQIAGLAATKANALVIDAPPADCDRALTALAASSWKPITYVRSTCVANALPASAPNGIIAATPLMDSNDPEWATNPKMVLYKAKVHQYQPTADVSSGLVGYGWTTASMLIETLKKSTTLDRATVMNTAHTLGFMTDIGIFVPGVVMSTARGDNFLGESYTLTRFNAAQRFMAPIDQVQIGDGVTPKFTPPNLINQ